MTFLMGMGIGYLIVGTMFIMIAVKEGRSRVAPEKRTPTPAETRWRRPAPLQPETPEDAERTL
jgi:hypothetical protein